MISPIFQMTSLRFHQQVPFSKSQQIQLGLGSSLLPPLPPPRTKPALSHAHSRTAVFGSLSRDVCVHRLLPAQPRRQQEEGRVQEEAAGGRGPGSQSKWA